MKHGARADEMSHHSSQAFFGLLLKFTVYNYDPVNLNGEVLCLWTHCQNNSTSFTIYRNQFTLRTSFRMIRPERSLPFFLPFHFHYHHPSPLQITKLAIV